MTSVHALALSLTVGILALSGCDQKGAESLAVGGDGILPVEYELTSNNFQKWRQAQAFLEAEPEYATLQAPTERVDLRRPTPESIQRVTTQLEEKPRVRTAIERTGLSVKDYVLATIALNQASLPGAALRRDGAPAFSLAAADRAEVLHVRRSSRVNFLDDRGSNRDSDEGDSDAGDANTGDSDRNTDNRNNVKGDRDSDGEKKRSGKDSDRGSNNNKDSR